MLFNTLQVCFPQDVLRVDFIFANNLIFLRIITQL